MSASFRAVVEWSEHQYGPDFASRLRTCRRRLRGMNASDYMWRLRDFQRVGLETLIYNSSTSMLYTVPLIYDATVDEAVSCLESANSIIAAAETQCEIHASNLDQIDQHLNRIQDILNGSDFEALALHFRRWIVPFISLLKANKILSHTLILFPCNFSSWFI